MSLADAGAAVTMAVRGDSLGRTMSAYLVERIEKHPRIDVRLHTQVTELHARNDCLSGVTLEDAGGAREERQARAIFICIGGEPRTSWAGKTGVRTNPAGYVLTGPGR